MLSEINSIWEAKESTVRSKEVEAAWTKTFSAALGKSGPLDFSLEKKFSLMILRYYGSQQFWATDSRFQGDSKLSVSKRSTTG